ncbi:MAG: NAD(P)H-hydrate dehydratase [Clostridiales bacterium]|jgi:NAD(P)H-hydrate epimerase|nr:NAD(P)H-hydrate dehydratase [Clostridiales bacterium]
MATTDEILTTPARMRELDRAAIRDYLIPGLILMENAAAGIAGYVLDRGRGLLGPERSVLVVCGKGSNGGDGFAVARKLHMGGCGVIVLVLAAREEIGGDAKTNLSICDRLGLNLIFATEATVRDVLPFCLARAELVVDAIFGTGFRGRPEGLYEIAIRAINESNKKVVSVDAPSGLDGLTGIAAGVCIRADVTLALGLKKIGLLSGPDAGLAGQIELIDIGIPAELTDGDDEKDIRLVTDGAVRALLPERRPDAHKGDFGKIMIVTGSPGMTGAGCLAAEAALTAGAGLVYLAVPGSLSQIYETAVKEAITLCAGSNVDRTISSESADAIAGFSGRMDAVAVGPGLSANQDTLRAVRKLLAAVQKPLVIDADALNAVAGDVAVLSRLKAPAVLTPHEGEMARLLDTAVANVSRNRLALARAFAAKWRVTLILKGHRSVIALPDGRAFINPTGNPGMATAGAGDALTGIVAAFLGAGMDAGDAAVAAAYLHGLSGDLAAKELGERSVRASDIIRCLPAALSSTAEHPAGSPARGAFAPRL